MSGYKNAGQNKNFAKGYPFVGYTVTNKRKGAEESESQKQ